MSNIDIYKNLIKVIPIAKQAMHAQKNVWKKRLDGSTFEVVKFLFNKEEIVITRSDILEEKQCQNKIAMILVWGYPNGGRGYHIQNILEQIDVLSKILSKVENKNLSRDEAEELISNLNKIEGMGPSTWSKLLHFFRVSVNSNSCQIFDAKIEKSLNTEKFKEFEKDKWDQHKTNDFFDYIERLSKVSRKLNVKPEQVENFLFYYNLNFKL